MKRRRKEEGGKRRKKENEGRRRSMKGSWKEKEGEKEGNLQSYLFHHN